MKRFASYWWVLPLVIAVLFGFFAMSIFDLDAKSSAIAKLHEENQALRQTLAEQDQKIIELEKINAALVKVLELRADPSYRPTSEKINVRKLYIQ